MAEEQSEEEVVQRFLGRFDNHIADDGMVSGDGGMVSGGDGMVSDGDGMVSDGDGMVSDGDGMVSSDGGMVTGSDELSTSANSLQICFSLQNMWFKCFPVYLIPKFWSPKFRIS